MPELRIAGLPQVYDWSAGLSILTPIFTRKTTKCALPTLPVAEPRAATGQPGMGRMGAQEITPAHIKGVMYGYGTQATHTSHRK
jgi:hypothetical protein